MFAWEEPDTKIVYRFNSSALYRYWDKNRGSGERTKVPISEDLYQTTKTIKGVEQHRLARLTKKDLKWPTLWIEWETDSDGKVWHTLIDGAHRICFAYEHGIFEVDALVFKEPVWKKCVIKLKDSKLDQMPPDPKSFSGIY